MSTPEAGAEFTDDNAIALWARQAAILAHVERCASREWHTLPVNALITAVAIIAVQIAQNSPAQWYGWSGRRRRRWWRW